MDIVATVFVIACIVSLFILVLSGILVIVESRMQQKDEDFDDVEGIKRVMEGEDG